MRTPKLCVKYDSTRNFHHQINNIIMPDNNNSDNFSIQLLFVDRFRRRPTASKNPVIVVLLFLLVAVIHIYIGSISIIIDIIVCTSAKGTVCLFCNGQF